MAKSACHLLSNLLLLLAALPQATLAFALSSPRQTWMTQTTTTTKSSSRSRLRVSPVVEAWDTYNAALSANPLVVKSVTAGVILGAADLAGQAIETARQEDDNDSNDDESAIDWARAARFAIFGLVLQAVRTCVGSCHAESSSLAPFPATRQSHASLYIFSLRRLAFLPMQCPAHRCCYIALESLLLSLAGWANSSHRGTLYTDQWCQGCH